MEGRASLDIIDPDMIRPGVVLHTLKRLSFKVAVRDLKIGYKTRGRLTRQAQWLMLKPCLLGPVR